MRSFWIFGLSVLLVACEANGDEQCCSREKTSSACETDLATSCAYLTKDKEGHIVLSWVKHLTDSTAEMCYAISADGGVSFGDTITISSSGNVRPHAENMPKMLFKPDGEIIAMWGADSPDPENKYAGLIFYAQSFDDGKTWSNARPLVADSSGHDQRYFDLALLPGGEACVIWLDDRTHSDKEGSALYFAATAGRNGFVNERLIGETCCPCCRTDLFIDSRSAIHVAYRKIINDSIRDMVHAVSVDSGRTFTTAERISADNWAINGCPHTGPTIAEQSSVLHFAWYTMGGGSGVFYCSSADNGKTFTPRDSVSGLATAKHPQMIALSNERILLVWDEMLTEKDSVRSRIGVQIRNAKGEVVLRTYPVSGQEVTEFPVIIETGNDKVLMAYCVKHEGKKEVRTLLLDEASLHQ